MHRRPSRRIAELQHRQQREDVLHPYRRMVLLDAWGPRANNAISARESVLSIERRSMRQMPQSLVHVHREDSSHNRRMIHHSRALRSQDHLHVIPSVMVLAGSPIQQFSRLPSTNGLDPEYTMNGQGRRTRSGVEYHIDDCEDGEEYEPQSDVSEVVSDVDSSSDGQYEEEDSEEEPEEPHRPRSQPEDQEDDSDNTSDDVQFDQEQFEQRMEELEELRKQKRIATMNKYLLRPPAQRSKQSTPTTLTCPITALPFEDPVVACDGHTYERNAIIMWLASNNKSPMTGGLMQSITLYSNMALRSLQDESITSSQHSSASV